MTHFVFRTILSFGLLAGSTLAQGPIDLFTKAPPDVDDALRTRMAKFFQAHVDGKPRRAEELVAEESKDFFYNSKKPTFLSYQIDKINYSPDFTTATAIVVVETYVPVLGFGTKPMKVPVTSMWKVIDGQWYWYITEDFINTTPFGKLGTPPGVSADPKSQLPDISNAPNLQSLAKQVGADKRTVTLKAGEPSSDQVTIRNQMPGRVALELRYPPLPGLDVKLDRTDVPGNENAILSFHYKPGKGVPRGALLVEVVVQPTNSVISLKVSFK